MIGLPLAAAWFGLPLAAAWFGSPVAVAVSSVIGLLAIPLLIACGGWCLFSFWFISVPPVRGGTYFSLPAAKKSRQKKAAQTANI